MRVGISIPPSMSGGSVRVDGGQLSGCKRVMYIYITHICVCQRVWGYIYLRPCQVGQSEWTEGS